MGYCGEVSVETAEGTFTVFHAILEGETKPSVLRLSDYPADPLELQFRHRCRDDAEFRLHGVTPGGQSYPSASATAISAARRALFRISAILVTKLRPPVRFRIASSR